MTRIRDKKSYMNYVCPHCFHTLDECTCEIYLPYHLIWIDRGIQEHVRILNQKGYKTTNSCESHNKNTNMYISFAYDYGFGDTLPMPNGFDLMKSHNAVSFLYKGKTTDEEFEVQKKEHLADLLEWCRNLPKFNSSCLDY